MTDDDYAIGLDMGTATLGWVSTKLNGKVERLKGQTAMGTRLFEEGQTAEERRMARTTRRRLKRRKWRLRLLREIFDEPMAKVDPNFFARLKDSNLSSQDERFQATYQLFNDRTDADFYEKYPTIYHLRWALMTQHRQFDLREIYLAMHHIVKYRGNFLRSGEPAAFKPGELEFGKLFTAINELWVTIFDEAVPQLPTGDLNDIAKVILDTDRGRQDRQRELLKLLMAKEEASKSWKPYFAEFSKAIMGLKAKIYLLTGNEVDKADQKSWTFSLADIEDHQAELETAFDDASQELVEELVNLQAAIQLTEIMPGGQYFSQSMVQNYENHAAHLKMLKTYADEQTDPKDKRAIRLAYDHYIDGDAKGKAETAMDFYKELNKILKKDADNPLVAKMMHEINLERFMPKQRTKENGVIPYQIHQQELDMIIQNQQAYYPFLGEVNPVEANRHAQPFKLDELVHFRIPYYVGPLVTAEQQAKNAAGQFAWMVRKPGQNGEITPWNFESKVDVDASASAFIERMKTTDTYLIGEDVLPLQSLLYQKFMVLNELNNVRINETLLTRNQKQQIYKNLFKTYGTVSIKRLQDYLVNHNDVEKVPKIEGVADPKHFNSSLSTYHDFQKLLPNDIDRDDRQVDIERMIDWSTVFEDRHIFQRKLQGITWLTPIQRKRISQLRYRGWGRLSAKLLTEIQDQQGLSIMDQLWRTQHNFMQIVHEPDYASAVEKHNAVGMNAQSVGDVINEMYTSPQNKKAIRQVLAVVKDIQNAHHGRAPRYICIEAARGAELNPQRSVQRSRQLQDLYADRAKSVVDEAIVQELKDQVANKSRFTDRLMLYFLQNGRDMYTGEKLSIDQLSNYDIDHILPQALIKDDSLDNRVLVKQKINRNKSDKFASEEFGTKMNRTWNLWHSMGLISARKLRHLTMRPNEIDKYAIGFINRQLVETRQVIKLVTEVLSSQYDPKVTSIVSVKAGLSHQLRRELNVPKLRDLNDYHHALDAYLAARIGLYLLQRYPGLKRFFVYGKYQNSRVDLQRFNFIRDLIRGEKAVIASPETGEIIWDRDADVSYLKHLAGLKHLLVTHEVVENHGAMFAQTIFKAKDDKKIGGTKELIATKKDRPSEVYGGYTKRKNAYLALIRVHMTKGDSYWVVGVPTLAVVSLKQARTVSVASERELLKKVLWHDVHSSRVKDFDIVLEHLYFNQLVRDEKAGKQHYFGLGPGGYYRNFQQLFLPISDQQALLARDLDNDRLIEVFDHICEQVKEYFGLYDMNRFRKSLLGSRDKFIALPVDDIVVDRKVTQLGKKSVLLQIMMGLHANPSFGDLKKSLGIKTPFGMLQTKHFELTGGAELIDESPTGLFKRVRKVSELEY